MESKSVAVTWATEVLMDSLSVILTLENTFITYINNNLDMKLLSYFA